MELTKRVIWWAGTLAAAYLAAVVGAFPVRMLGVIVDERLIWPLTLANGGLWAALAACAVGVKISSDPTRPPHFTSVLVGTLVGTAVAGGLSSAIPTLLNGNTVGDTLLRHLVVVALAAAAGSARYRHSGSAAVTLPTAVKAVLIGLAIVIGAIVVGSFFGLTGA